jgi:hypothetical protein
MSQSLVFVNGMNNLRPEIPGRMVALVNTLVQPLNRDIDGPRAVLLDQFTRLLGYPRGHRMDFLSRLHQS